MSVVIEDTFVDTNGTLLTAHVISPTNVPGASWSGFGTAGSTTSIQSNSASIPDTSGATPTAMHVDSGHSDVTVTVTMTVPYAGEAQGFFARLVDNLNGFYGGVSGGNLLYIGQITAGSYAAVASTAYTVPIGTPTTFTMQANGPNYTLTALNDGTNVSYSSSTGQTGTLQGLLTGQANFGLNMQYNDFIVSISTVAGDWIAPFTNNITRYEENYV